MPYIPSKKEFEAVKKIDIDKRLKYFANIVGDHCEMWLCCDDDGTLFYGYDKQGCECVLVWPAKEYAELILRHDDVRCLKNMEIHNFLKEYIYELIALNIHVFVFPNKDLNGAIMTAESFRNMMEEELDKME
jgi:hypothetical protein